MNTNGRHPHRASQRGFTLVELLIALVLTGLIMSLLFAGLRISSRAWDSADRRQQAVAEQYQLQQQLRRLISQSESQRIQASDGSVQVAFRGERDQLIFLAPRFAAGAGSGMLWYRLFVSEATDDRPAALVMATLDFTESRTLDWDRLFDPDPGLDDQGEPLPAPEEHVLRLTGEAELLLSYRYQNEEGLAQTEEEWIDQGVLPLMVELSLEEDEFAAQRTEAEPATPAPNMPAPDTLLPSWQALAIALQAYNHEVRSDVF